MGSRRLILFSAVAALIVAISLVTWHWLTKPATPRLALHAVSFAEIPGWPGRDVPRALAAFQRSCAVILAMREEAAMGGYGGRAKDWQKVCAIALKTKSSAALSFFQSQFRAYAISENGSPQGLFTGYYEPFLHASRTRHGIFETPVYGVPTDLVRVDLSQFRPEWRGEHVFGRVEQAVLVPFLSRAEIDAGLLKKAPILFYGDDPVGVFFMHIQGSGRAQLDDGSVVRISYAAQNGRPYTAIGRTLVHIGALDHRQVTMQSIRHWLEKNPKEAQSVLETDASYIFFKEEPIGDPVLGAKGAEGVALTPLASVAVDLRLHPLGVPIFVGPAQRILIAQDTGGAIRGAVRGDIYFGFGPMAENAAGTTKATGTMTVLLPVSLYGSSVP